MFKYFDLLKEIDEFERRGVEVGSIGNSTLGFDTPYIFIGDKNKNCIVVTGAIHAREHITALLVVNQAKHLLKNLDLTLLGGIYFIPMVNVDGVRLCQEGVGFLTDKQLKKNLIKINGGTDFSLWKANIAGVDLNVNFDARWGQGKSNVFYKAPSNYVGKKPNSEVETKNLVRFTRTVNPLSTVSYHCKGEVIFWRFFQKDKRTLWQHYCLAKSLSQATGYRLIATEAGSCGGYKDWCIDRLGIPAFTVEVGNDKFSHPYPYDQFEDIYNKNIDVPRRLLNTVCREKERASQNGSKDKDDETGIIPSEKSFR